MIIRKAWGCCFSLPFFQLEISLCQAEARHPPVAIRDIVAPRSRTKLTYHGTNGTFSCTARPVNRSVYQWCSVSRCRRPGMPDRRAGGRTRGRTHDHHAGRAEVSRGARGRSSFCGLCALRGGYFGGECKRIRMFCQTGPCIPRSSSVGEPKRALGRPV